jgi:hypothetical protein
MFWVGDTDGAVVDGPVVVVGAALVVAVAVVGVDVVVGAVVSAVVDVVEVGALLALLPHAAVTAPAAMIVTAVAAAAMRPAFDPDLIFGCPVIPRLFSEGTVSPRRRWRSQFHLRICCDLVSATRWRSAASVVVN